MDTYYPALLAHLVVRLRIDYEEAEDLLQGFIAEKVLERRLLVRADPQFGKLRSLLLKALNNYVMDAFRRRRVEQLSVAAYTERAAGENADSDIFDVIWAQRTLAEAIRRMRCECQQGGRADLWKILAGRILNPVFFADVQPLSYATLVERFDFHSPKQAVNAVITARRHFRRVLCRVIAEYVDNEVVEAELDDLRSILSRVGNAGLRLPALALTGDAVGESERDTTDPGDLAIHFGRHDDQSPWRIDELRAVWAHQLRSPLHIELADQPESTNFAKAPFALDPPLITFGDLFEHPCPPVELLRCAKRYAKEFVRLQTSTPCGELATALYYCCIATALVRHRTRISTLAESIMTAGIRMTMQRQWIDETSMDLLDRALSVVEN